MSHTISILVPTRNRPAIAAQCIASACEQLDSDFELIISDNSDDSGSVESLKNAVAKLRTPSATQYIRPPRPMNMPDHWEFATGHANGEYVAILTDRHAIRPSAVATWKSIIETTQPELLIWNVRSGYSTAGLMRTEAYDGKLSVRSARGVLEEFLRLDQWNAVSMYTNILPRGLNSLFHRELADRIRSRHERLFFPLSPDYTSAFLLLAEAEAATYINLPFYSSFGNQSNGQASAILGTEHYASTFDGIDQYERCPTRIDSVFNTIVRDYLSMQAMEPNLRTSEFSPEGYCLSLYRDLMVKEWHGSPLDTMSMRKELDKHVMSLDADALAAVKEGLRLLESRRPSAVGLRKLLFRAGMLAPLRRFADRVRAACKLSDATTRYTSVVEAVRETDNLQVNW